MAVRPGLGGLGTDGSRERGRQFVTTLAAAGGAAALVGACGLGLGWRKARAVGLDRWLPGYLATRNRRRIPDPSEPIRVFVCIADHYEPKHGGASPAAARARVDRWVAEYPARFAKFRDSDGRPPRHSFFYPAEEYEPELLDGVQTLCQRGFGEIEVHLHHDNDTSENLAAQLLSFVDTLAQRHGSLSKNRTDGRFGYVFVHGNWALDNSRPDGRWCGVNDELDVLQRTGCYADMTFPSAPSTTQPPTINTIYRAIDDPHLPRSHDYGTPLAVGAPPTAGLLMVPGPLTLDWTRKKFGVLPRIENACIQASQPLHIRRLDNWLRAAVGVAGRPDWYFVKLHTHGAVEANADTLLGNATEAFHVALAQRAAERPGFRYHYLTARETINVVLAAEAGATDWRPELRDFVWQPPEGAAPAST